MTKHSMPAMATRRALRADASPSGTWCHQGEAAYRPTPPVMTHTGTGLMTGTTIAVANAHFATGTRQPEEVST